nr:MAG TPA: hypothetical protein [Caudoviricetes sp.]
MLSRENTRISHIFFSQNLVINKSLSYNLYEICL